MNDLGHKIKLGVIAGLAILVLIIAIQNTANVETKLLFATITMPRAILLFVMMAIGFVIGWLSCARYSFNRKNS
jgi:uncharacterized integral membrane protein